MSESAEQQLSQALLERLGPLIITVENQLKDLAQGQVLLQSNISALSTELDMTQTELDKVHDTFARLPHYVAKVVAMRNTIATVTTLSRKLKRRANQVATAREKQAVKAQATRAKEQAYDQAVAAVQAAPSTLPRPQVSRQSSASVLPSTLNSQAQDRPRTPTRITSTQGPTMASVPDTSAASSQLPSQTQPSASAPASIGLPFPLPAKPAFPVVSAMRSSSRAGTPPPSLSPGISPLLSGKASSEEATTPPTSTSGTGALIGGESEMGSEQGEQVERVDLFPQVSTALDDTLIGGSEVEVVRVRRKKKVVTSKSSASSIASTSTTASSKKPQTKIKSTRSVLNAQQPGSQESHNQSESRDMTMA
ncbi:MAG: hypothetical protein J3Q66DRAFT_444620 [Benniella sp.]|nr:MAG: hypothetical protein J3Q66DRAFT_444620 [Benniella sp.]